MHIHSLAPQQSSSQDSRKSERSPVITGPFYLENRELCGSSTTGLGKGFPSVHESWLLVCVSLRVVPHAWP